MLTLITYMGLLVAGVASAALVYFALVKIELI
jgi:hypothetical protein